MYVYSFISFVATSCNILALASLNWSDNKYFKDFSWSKGVQQHCGSTIDCFSVYSGVYGLLVDSVTTEPEKTRWSNSQCSASYCGYCRWAMVAVIILSGVSLLFSLPSIYTDYQRGNNKRNNIQFKVVGAVFSCIAMLCSLAAVLVFTFVCQHKLEAATDDDYRWSYGTSWILMLSMAVLKFVDVVANIVISTGERPFDAVVV